MAYSVRNIIVGAAALYISKADSTQAAFYNGNGGAATAIPSDPANGSIVAAFESSNAWRAGGFTTDGIEISYEPDYGDITVDQLLDSAKMYKQGMRVSVNTTFSEATLENVLVVWGQQTSSLTSGAGGEDLSIAAGGLGDEPVERSLAFVGPAPRNAANAKRERLYHVRRALSVETTAFSLARSDATVLPVSFRVLPDPTVTGAEYGSIRDRVVG